MAVMSEFFLKNDFLTRNTKQIGTSVRFTIRYQMYSYYLTSLCDSAGRQISAHYTKYRTDLKSCKKINFMFMANKTKQITIN